MNNKKKPKRQRRQLATPEPALRKAGWRKHVAAVLFALMVLAILIGTSYLGASMALDGHSSDQGQNIVVTDTREIPKKYYSGNCTTETFRDMVEVYMMPERSVGIQGQYISNQRAIVLYDRGINVIAHEVSHYVDSVVAAHGINDGEARAYLQGYFTECVYDMVMASSTGTITIAHQ